MSRVYWLPRDVDDLHVQAGLLLHTDPQPALEGSREPEAVRVRWLVAAALRARGLPLEQVAQAVGRHHTTVMYGLREVASDPWLAGLAQRLALQGGLARTARSA